MAGNSKGYKHTFPPPPHSFTIGGGDIVYKKIINRVVSDETLAKMRARKHSDYTKALIGASYGGRTHTE
jgi:regulator of extracellular matrix RemA (YlzA/DUF370 family)